MKNTINLSDATTGELIPLGQQIKIVGSTLNIPSVLNEIAKPSGRGAMPGWLLKKNKRTQTKQIERTALGSTSGFKGANAQVIDRVFVERITREDNIIVSRLDIAKLREGQGGDIVAQETADFLLTARELDLKDLLGDVRTKAKAAKIYTSVANATANAIYATKPSGNQPTLADNTIAKNIEAINGGLRIAQVDDAALATTDARIKLIRAIFGYANKLGSDASAEAFYPFSINGIPLNSLKVLTDYINCVAIKDSFTTTVINLNNPGDTRNLNGLVGFIDTVKVLITNQKNKDDLYNIVSDRIIVRDMCEIVNYVGTIKEGTSIILSDGTTKNVKPSEMVVQFESARLQGSYYHEEFWAIEKV